MDHRIRGTAAAAKPLPKPQVSYEELVEQLYGNWVWRAVHALLDHCDFRSSPLWISERLAVSEIAVNEALDGLSSLGLITFFEGKIVRKEIKFIIPEAVNTPQARHEAHKSLSIQLMARSGPNSPGNFGRSVILASNEALVIELKNNLMKLFVDFNQKSADLPFADRLFAVTANCVDLLPNSEKENAQ